MHTADYDSFLEDIPFPAGEVERLKVRAPILKHAKKRGRIAEIGVFRGHFSEVILERLQPAVFFMVDKWTMNGEHWSWGADTEYMAFGELTTALARDDAARRAKKFEGRGIDILLVENASTAFADDLRQAGETLDAVYLDASHLYESTLRELAAFAKVLAPGGVIMGDDWRPDRTHRHHGVFKAVTEFVKSTDFEIVAADHAMQWCIRRTHG